MTDEANLFGTGAFGEQLGAGNTTDVATLITDILTMTGIGSNNTAYREVALAFMNEAYKTILKGRHWKFLNKELFLDLPVPYESGEVDLENNSDVVNASTQPTSPVNFNVTHVGQMFHVSGQDEYYRIIDLEGTQGLKVSPAYTGTTATDSSYKILTDRLRLDSKVQAIRSLAIMGEREIKGTGIQQLRRMKAHNPTLTGVPEWFTVVDSEAQDGSITVEFYPSPDKQYGVHIEYTERPLRLEDSETCYTALPPQHSDVLTLYTRAKIYQDQNNAVMAREIGQEAAGAWNRMAGDQEMTDSVAKLKHGRNYFQRRRQQSVYYGLKHFGKFDD